MLAVNKKAKLMNEYLYKQNAFKALKFLLIPRSNESKQYDINEW